MNPERKMECLQNQIRSMAKSTAKLLFRLKEKNDEIRRVKDRVAELEQEASRHEA